ncbi:hypothetical protein NKH75_07060 [Mesorhizobium sp. M0984]|uniref:hypothetical protein n=1 Tax=unclassified Mesorhizobium TaxID=325217 RepID=UPI003335E514
MRVLLLAAVFGALAACGPAAGCEMSGPVGVYNGYGTGADFLLEGEAEARAYIRGFVNGILVSVFVKADESCVNGVQECLVNKTDFQLAAILRKYLNNDPKIWDQRLNGLTFTALLYPCLKPKEP